MIGFHKFAVVYKKVHWKLPGSLGKYYADLRESLERRRESAIDTTVERVATAFDIPLNPKPSLETETVPNAIKNAWEPAIAALLETLAVGGAGLAPDFPKIYSDFVEVLSKSGWFELPETDRTHVANALAVQNLMTNFEQHINFQKIPDGEVKKRIDGFVESLLIPTAKGQETTLKQVVLTHRECSDSRVYIRWVDVGRRTHTYFDVFALMGQTSENLGRETMYLQAIWEMFKYHYRSQRGQGGNLVSGYVFHGGRDGISAAFTGYEVDIYKRKELGELDLHVFPIQLSARIYERML